MVDGTDCTTDSTFFVPSIAKVRPECHRYERLTGSKQVIEGTYIDKKGRALWVFKRVYRGSTRELLSRRYVHLTGSKRVIAGT